METYKSGLNAELTAISPCTLQLTATVPAEVGKKAYNRHLDYYSKHVQKPGFRAGHIPQSMILSLHGKAILSDTAAYLANQAVEEVVAEKKLTWNVSNGLLSSYWFAPQSIGFTSPSVGFAPSKTSTLPANVIVL